MLHFSYYAKAKPESVLKRSAVCNIEWPSYKTISKEELDFPLAYVITAFTDARNLELTLASIFRPHNSYCIHIDQKADRRFRESMENIMECYGIKYPGSFMKAASKSEDVMWGHYSIVQAEINCLSDLIASKRWIMISIYTYSPFGNVCPAFLGHHVP